MTETLHRPVSSESEQLERYTKQLAIVKGIREQSEAPANVEEFHTPVEFETVGTHVETRDVSPFAVRVRNAAERFATILEKRAVSRAHSEALKEYRDRDHSDYVDHVAGLASDGETDETRKFNKALLRKEERRSDREELIEGATLQLRALGGLALDKTKDAGYIAVGIGALGYEKAEKVTKDAGLIALGVGVMGYEAAGKRVQVAKFKHEVKSDDRAFRKNYAKEMKQFDKGAQRDAKALKKDQKVEMRQAKKDDRSFERDMKRKATVEKWQGRVQKTAETYEKVKTTTVEKKRKMGRFALKARTVGTAAWSAGRDEFKK